MGPLFVTGAFGFVGRRFLEKLRDHSIDDVRLLARHPERNRPAVAWPRGWRVVAGDLEAPNAWAATLENVHTVLHLAGRTGKASRRDHEAVNLEATRRLVEAARLARVSRFVFVSSIAAGFPDKRHYHYAAAKAAAERIVAESGLNALIIRPTIVLGPGSPSLLAFERLAKLPVPILFGGDPRVQPIHVDDLAAALVAALAMPEWPASHDPVELGGPDVVMLSEIFARIRSVSGLPRRQPIRVPLTPLRTLLAAAEPFALRVLPFSSGQLAAFANPSVAKPSELAARLPHPTLGIDAMLGARHVG